MAVKRIWFPHAPDGSIDAGDRAQLAVGYYLVTVGIAPKGFLWWPTKRKEALTFAVPVAFSIVGDFSTFKQAPLAVSVHVDQAAALPLVMLQSSEAQQALSWTLSKGIVGNFALSYSVALVVEMMSELIGLSQDYRKEVLTEVGIADYDFETIYEIFEVQRRLIERIKVS